MQSKCLKSCCVQRLVEVTELLAAKLDLASNELDGHANRHNSTSQHVVQISKQQDNHSSSIRYKTLHKLNTLEIVFSATIASCIKGPIPLKKVFSFQTAVQCLGNKIARC
jgi:hypothetical protein